jgi:hypothetical protein
LDGLKIDDETIDMGTTIDKLWLKPDGTKLYYKCGSNLYERDKELKVTRQIFGPSDGEYVPGIDSFMNSTSRYDIESGQTTKFWVPGEGAITNYKFDNMGTKMVFETNTDIKMFYPDGLQGLDKYLFSFDGKNSWYTCKDGNWSIIKSGSDPTSNELIEYGMTAEEINSLTKSDYAELYEDGREIYSFDISVYFASPNFSISPSLNGIYISLAAGKDIYDTDETMKAIYTTKQQAFDASDWRKINRIYPVEISPRAS